MTNNHLNTLIGILRDITSKISSSNLLADIESLKRYKKQDLNSGLAIAVPALNNIKTLLKKLEPDVFYPDASLIYERLGIADLIGTAGFNNAEILRKQVASGMPESYKGVKDLTLRLETLSSKIPSMLEMLSELGEEEEVLDETKSIIEISFQNNTAIDDIAQAKKEMGEWKFIILGMAALSDIDIVDFEIIHFSKNSPTTVAIRTTLIAGLLFLDVFGSVVEFATKVLEYKTASETMKNADKEWGEAIDKRVKERVDEMLEQEKIKISAEVLKKTKKSQEIAAVVEKSIEKQFDFVVNGGQVNFFIAEGNGEGQIQKLKEGQHEVQNLFERTKHLTQITKDASQVVDDVDKNIIESEDESPED